MLRGVTGIVVVAALAAAARPAFAQPAQEPVQELAQEPRLGIDIGLRVGYGVPQGRINESIPLVLNDVIASMVPLAIDAGYHVDGWVAVGLMLQYGILQFRDAGQACGPDANCRGSSTAIAAHVTLEAPVSWHFLPWLRLGTGYEWLRMQLTGEFMGAPADIDVRFRGWMFGFAEGGANYVVNPELAIGPFVGVSVGRYNFGADSDTPEKPLIYKRVHEWITFGVRGVFSR